MNVNYEWSFPSPNMSLLVDSKGRSRVVMKQGPYLDGTGRPAKFVVSGDGYETTEHWIQAEAMAAAEASLRDDEA
jgi:hypothetical protein